MSSTYTDYSPFKRYMSIIEILKSWGPLERKDVEQLIKSSLGLDDSDSIEKTLRRDLKNLVGEQEVDEFAFNKQGFYLGRSNVDSISERVRYYKYQLAGKDFLDISGKSELQNNNGDIFISPGLEHYLRIKKGELTQDFNRYGLYFELQNELYHLEIDLKTLTLARSGEWMNIIVGANRQVRKKDIHKILEDYGPYCVVLLLNDPFLSAPTRHHPGHFRISFQEKGRYIVEDFGSKNGTTYCSLDDWSCDKLLSDLTFNNDKTKTRYWTEMDESDLIPFVPKSPELITKETILIKAKNAGLIFKS